MKNSTTIKIPKKYQAMISEVYKDSDGYWAYSEDGFMFTDTECHTAHEDTHKDLLRVIRSLAPCDCYECIKGMQEKAEVDVESVPVEYKGFSLGQVKQLMMEKYEGQELIYIEGKGIKLIDSKTQEEVKSFIDIKDVLTYYVNEPRIRL